MSTIVENLILSARREGLDVIEVVESAEVPPSQLQELGAQEEEVVEEEVTPMEISEPSGPSLIEGTVQEKLPQAGQEREPEKGEESQTLLVEEVETAAAAEPSRPQAEEVGEVIIEGAEVEAPPSPKRTAIGVTEEEYLNWRKDVFSKL